MAIKVSPIFCTFTILPAIIFIFLYSTLLHSPTYYSNQSETLNSAPCNLFKGHWVSDPNKIPLYNDTCPFHRNAWNCYRSKRPNMDRINSWKWVPEQCELKRVDPVGFLSFMRNKNIGLIGDSLNQNFLASFLCILRVADPTAKRWKKKGAWVGAYFPKFNVTVAYHRAVLLSKYQLQPKPPEISGLDGVKEIHRVDVDIPADDWARIADFYDVVVFNTGHWWVYDKFPKETPLVFYMDGKPINPPLDLLDGFKATLKQTVKYVQRTFSKKTVKFWRLQSPRHFHGGDWNQNGSCVFDEPLEESQLDLWFDPRNNGVNTEARLLNHVIKEALKGSDIKLLDLNHLSEYRADAHPALWLGMKDAVAVWGQDCMHWCLPGVPDTWVDILSHLIMYNSEMN